MPKCKKPPDDKNHTAEKEVMGLTDYEVLRSLHDRIDRLISVQVTQSDIEFQIWKKQTERLIFKHCGEFSIEYKQLKSINFVPSITFGYESYEEFVSSCRDGLEIVRGMLENFLEEWRVEGVYMNRNKAFVVHGHDELLKQQVARLLEQQGIEAVILSEQANAGKTIIEKIEKHSDVGAAILLFTPDDTGKANAEQEARPRARQNVIFEAGFFMGKLGRNNTIMLVTDNSIELPSDLHGVVYTSENRWQYALILELKEMGFNVDMNKVKV